MSFLLLSQTDALSVFSQLGLLEWIFLCGWGLFSVLYWRTYIREESIFGSTAKVGLLFLFVYAIFWVFDWVGLIVPPEEAMTLGIFEVPLIDGPRVPLVAAMVPWLVLLLVGLVIWSARGKFSVAFSLILSAWDRGHWYMLPVIFILMTIGLLLAAAAASPILSPFIYTLF